MMENSEYITNQDNDQDDYRMSVTLGMRALNLSTEEVSSAFGLKPTHTFERGEIFIPKHGSFSGQEVMRRWGVWQYSSENFVQSEDIADHMNFILKIFEKKADVLQHYLDDPVFDVGLRIWFESKCQTVGLGFENATMLRMLKICNYVYFTLALDECGYEECNIRFL